MADQNARNEGDSPVLYFPNDDGLSFEEACLLAAESHRPLHLLQRHTRMSEIIKLRQHHLLSICGISTSETDEGRVQISGRLHSLFILNNHSRLVLTDVDLTHEAPNDDDCRQVGAAINLRYKGSARIDRSTITSESGFCGWAVQKARMELRGCTLRAPLRSALVCFGQARLDADLCLIEKAGVHGICARGPCTIHVRRSCIVESTVRGLYAYANAHVTLEKCVVARTIRPDMAAIEVTSANNRDGHVGDDDKVRGARTGNSAPNHSNDNEKASANTSSLVIKDCRIVDNTSAGIRLRGDVHHNNLVKGWVSSGNLIERNLGGDIDCLTNPTCGNERVDQENNEIGPTANQPLRRDASGSSFRKGDWWCPTCRPMLVIPGSRDSCILCNTQWSQEHLLTTEEIIRLNHGVSEIPAENVVTTSAAAQMNGIQTTVTWWFDGDGAWIPYDMQSSSKLEEIFQLLAVSRDSNDVNPVVHLSEGRYRVNVLTMVQVNTVTHFPRLVCRK